MSAIDIRKTRMCVRRITLSGRPEILPGVVAEHYASLATYALHIRELSKLPLSPATNEVMSFILEDIREKYVEYFGCEPGWVKEGL